jgi:hypothetical protein
MPSSVPLYQNPWTNSPHDGSIVREENSARKLA